MTIHLPEDLASSIRTEVIAGHFANEDALVAEAVKEYLQRLRGQIVTANSNGNHSTSAESQENAQDLQWRLYDAGLVSEIKPPITDFAPYRHRQAVPIKGEPLSETVIRERR